MGQLLSNPSSVPVSVATDWQTLLNVNASGNVGFNAISLQNWDAGTLAPAIAAGSMIEINGSIAYFQNEEAIGGAVTGWNYLQFIVSGSTVTPSWSGVPLAWNSAKNAWFIGSNRASGHVCNQSGGSYSSKYQRIQGPNYLNVIAGENKIFGPMQIQGGVNTDNTTVRIKKFSGSLNSSGDATFPHGLDFSKILTVAGSYATSAGTSFYTLRNTAPSQAQYYDTVEFNSTNIILTLGINTFPNGLYRVTVFYEA